MGGKGKKRAKNKQHQQSGQHKRQQKSHADSEFSETVVLKGRPGRAQPVPGLSNLGNTCFFNSVMQNLGQSRYFRAELGSLLAKPSYTVEIKLPGREESRQLCVKDEVGPLAKALLSFLTQMQNGGRVLNPRPVFSEISKKAPRFSGYHQQDSQELLRCLLDILRAEEIKRIKRTVLTSYNVSGVKSEHLTDSDRADIKAYGLQAHFQNTFVDRAFGGVLTSTVVCKECMNKSSMHESFLDLSLPIGEDKNMSPPTNHQSKSKGKKKGELPLPKSKPELSKYQLKKQEKQARKAARSANKKSLQKFLTDTNPSSPTDAPENAPENPEVAKQNEASEHEPVSKEGDKDTNEDVEAAEVEIAEGDSSNQEISTTTGPNTAGGDYAVVGPLPDTGTINDANSVQDAITVSEISNVQDTSTVLEQEENPNIECEVEEMVNQQPEPVQTAHSKPNSESAQAALPESLVQTFESLKVRPDSLEASLKKFCTPELLTGANKFACVVCTKLRHEDQSTVSTEEPAVTDKAVMSENPPSVLISSDTTTEEGSVLNDVPGAGEATDIVNDPEGQEVADSKDSVVSEEPVNSSVSDSQENTSQQDDSSAEADNEESSEEEQPPPKPSSSIAFCEATKQILVEKAPLILTLHLKRFVQHGRRLLKNNKYVSFPLLLDMTPFCTQDKEESGNDQLLYSLYGIVEHSGSMQGGHYVAYVKQHSPGPKNPTTTNSTEDSSADNVNKTLTEVERDESETVSTSEACPAKDSKNFDTSCTLGQWYHISDSHVRTATESEVMRSQAYLLFYERIPQM